MGIREAILDVARSKKLFKAADVIRRVPSFSRQYISSVLGEMVKGSTLLKSGSGRWTVYAIPKHADYLLGRAIRRRLPLKGLKEHEVLADIMRDSLMLKKASENVRSVFNYAFSEMLNNAIDHSRSDYVVIEVLEKDHILKFIVNDFGIGVFRNVMKQRGLNSEFEAIQDLLKGKTTTAPRAHSGEGIFFTSKVADVFSLESFGYRLRIDNLIGDIFVEQPAINKVGTKVMFEISINSRRHLADVFSKYQTSPEEPAFDKTEIRIKLYTMGTIYVSRSQARRVLTGLDKFKTVILDFENVPTIGQAFADEIFRVFKIKHPNIIIIPINTNEAVKFMIKRSSDLKVIR